MVWAPDSVPITVVGQPAASVIAAMRWAVVVLPFVPVMPTITRSSLGRPCTPAASGPIAALVSRTTSWGTSTGSGWSTSSAAAPAATAASAKSWPSACSPRRQAKTSPGATARESWLIPATSTVSAADQPWFEPRWEDGEQGRKLHSSHPTDPGGGSMPSSWIIVGASSRNTGAAAVPPKRSLLSGRGWSIDTRMVTCGSSAGRKPTKLA